MRLDSLARISLVLQRWGNVIFATLGAKCQGFEQATRPSDLGPSLLGDELFRYRYRPRAEIIVPGAGNAH